MFIGIDPGKHVGVATFQNNGTLVRKSIMNLDSDFLTWLQMLIASSIKEATFVVEDYKLRQDLALEQVGSDIPAARCIGMIQLVSQLVGNSKIVFAKPADLRGALKWAGHPELARKPKSWHCPDDMAAYAHAVKYLIDQGIRKHPIFG